MSVSARTPSQRATDAEAVTRHSKTVETDDPELTVIGAAIAMVVTTTLVAFHAYFIVGNINFHALKMFQGLIVIPFVGNLVEHWTAVVMAFTESRPCDRYCPWVSVQVATLVLPIVVLVSWIPRVKSLSLVLDYFQVTCLAVTGTLISASNPGLVLSMQGKYEEAEVTHRWDLEVSEKVLGLEHPGTLIRWPAWG
ncbi:uncharacterized protein K441DRAFT_679668 [Cenococcum geophilum 1.58]|uniref:uncharacterized protein n=1 Tax=Cenococcum geophilum 1.58 TaxID=794803 RepID=UPI00358F7CE9|nr:hypothetical protein K441DRAFT_679668 [Cenococcum geophilum 1.58]